MTACLAIRAYAVVTAYPAVTACAAATAYTAVTIYAAVPDYATKLRRFLRLCRLLSCYSFCCSHNYAAVAYQAD